MNMKKNTVRLTESQLHKIIRESVKRVIREVKFGGQSFHGDNPSDWVAMGSARENYYEPNDWNDYQIEKDYENAENLGGTRRDGKGMTKGFRAARKALGY